MGTRLGEDQRKRIIKIHVLKRLNCILKLNFINYSTLDCEHNSEDLCMTKESTNMHLFIIVTREGEVQICSVFFLLTFHHRSPHAVQI